MALLFADGFDVYADMVDAVRGGWTAQSLNSDFSTTLGRFGGGCLVSSAGSGAWARSMWVASGGTMILGFAYWHNGAGGATDVMLRVRGDEESATADTQLLLTHNAAGDLTASGSVNDLGTGTQIGSTASAAIPASTWVWVEVKCLFSTAAGTLEVKVNGTTVIGPATSVNTLDATTTGADFLMFGGASEKRIDDIICMDSSGSTFNNFLGDSRIDTLIPNAAGGVTNWTPNTGTQVAAVDDALAASDNDTTYIASSTAAQEARFTFTDLTVDPNDIWAVQLRGRTRKPNVGTRTGRGLINSAGTEALGATMGFPIDYSWRMLGVWDQNPATSAPWSTSAVNALQAGVEIVA